MPWRFPWWHSPFAQVTSSVARHADRRDDANVPPDYVLEVSGGFGPSHDSPPGMSQGLRLDLVEKEPPWDRSTEELPDPLLLQHMSNAFAEIAEAAIRDGHSVSVKCSAVMRESPSLCLTREQFSRVWNECIQGIRSSGHEGYPVTVWIVAGDPTQISRAMGAFTAMIWDVALYHDALRAGGVRLSIFRSYADLDFGSTNASNVQRWLSKALGDASVNVEWKLERK